MGDGKCLISYDGEDISVLTVADEVRAARRYSYKDAVEVREVRASIIKSGRLEDSSLNNQLGIASYLKLLPDKLGLSKAGTIPIVAWLTSLPSAISWRFVRRGRRKRRKSFSISQYQTCVAVWYS